MNYLRQLTITALICFNFHAMAQLTKGSDNHFESEKGTFNKLTDDKSRPLGLNTYVKYSHEGIMFPPSVTPIGSYHPEEEPSGKRSYSGPYLKVESNRPISEFKSIYEYDAYHSSWIIEIAKWWILDSYGRQFQE